LKKIIADIRKIDKELALIFTIAAFSLIGNYYFSHPEGAIRFLKQLHLNQLGHYLETIRYESENRRFFDLAFWVSILSVNYILLPSIFCIFIKIIPFQVQGFQ